jgi:peptidoglycan biosynthesis protein MviN/MurJ (putative lipid II flippase)
MHSTGVGTWTGDWAWSLPLIVLTVVIHVCGLAIIGERVVDILGESVDRRRFMYKFAVVMAVTSLLATILHGIEGAIWAAAYRFLDALPDNRTAMLYSISAMTSYGHANLFLKDRWQLMGALEALNGMLLFGLTTAFLFAMIQRVWPIGSREHHRNERNRHSND